VFVSVTTGNITGSKISIIIIISYDNNGLTHYVEPQYHIKAPINIFN